MKRIQITFSNPVAARKLQAMLDAGWQINGVSLSMQIGENRVDRAAVTTGGMVLWWHNPQQDGAASQAPAKSAKPAQSEPQSGGFGFDDMDDDIPFLSNSPHFDMTTSKQRKMTRYDY